jgi:hypothetical protein
VKKEQKNVKTMVQTNQSLEETNVIPMKKEVEIKGNDQSDQPAKIIFITSGFGKIQVPATTINSSPMAIAA